MVHSAYVDEKAANAAVAADGYKLNRGLRHAKQRPRRGGVGGREAIEQCQHTQPTKSSFRRYGNIGLLVLDAPPPPETNACGATNQSTNLLRRSQWALFERAQRVEGIVALLICCDRPLVAEPSQWTHADKVQSTTSSDPAACDQRPEVLRIIESLFQWLAFPLGGAQQRTVQVLCGMFQ